jgi:hypothetical protein
MKIFNKIITDIKLFFNSIFYGLSGAEKTINGPTGSAENIAIIQQQLGNGGVFADMLEQKKTQEVAETVDAYYRVFRESQRFDVSDMQIIGEDENGVIFKPITKLKHKTLSDFLKHPPVFNPDNAKIRTIQDNKHLENTYHTNQSELFNYETTLNVTRDNFIPRFKIEKIAKRMVVRECEDNKALVDIYVPSEASQFGKIDAIVISNLFSLKNEGRYKSDLVDFKTIEWVSDKAWNSEDIMLFRYNVIQLIGINEYDGSLVLTYLCEILDDGYDLTAKYKTAELDKKYSEYAPKREVVDIFCLERNLNKKGEKKEERIDLNNLNKTNFKL